MAFSALEELRSGGILVGDSTPEEVKNVLEGLSQSEVAVLRSVNARIKAAKPDVEAMSLADESEEEPFNTGCLVID